MGRHKERTIGTVLLLVGVILLGLPLFIYRSDGVVTGIITALLTILPGLLALRAGQKLWKYPPRREITLDDLRSNARRYKFWNRIGLI